MGCSPACVWLYDMSCPCQGAVKLATLARRRMNELLRVKYQWPASTTQTVSRTDHNTINRRTPTLRRTRGCPKLALSHLLRLNTGKMRYKLATQVFSRSVATGIKYYSSRWVPGLQNVKATVDFPLKMNDWFEALNWNHPKEGLRLGGKDLRVLASSLHWLNTWKRELVSGKISRESFLTESTDEGSRVTILSATELSKFVVLSSMC